MSTGRPDPNALVAAFAASDFSGDDQAWNEAVEQERPPDEFAIPQPDEDGNYQSPSLTRILEAYRRYLETPEERRALLKVIEQAQQGMDRLLSTLELSAEEGLDDAENPIHQAARTGFDEFLAGLEDLQQALAQRDEDAGEQALGALQSATNRIMDAYAFFQKLRNVAMTVACPSCGAENRKGSPKCSECGTVLPTLEEKTEGRIVAENTEGVLRAETAPAMTTPNYSRLDQAIGLWRTGESDDARLLSEIQAVESNMNGHQAANRAELEDMEGLTEQEVELTTRILGSIDLALTGSLEAIAEMKLYWEDKDPEHLYRGMTQLGPPTQQMIEAFLAMQSLNTDDEEEEED